MKTLFELRPIFSALMRNKLGPVLVAMQVALSLAILANAIYIVNLRLEVAARPSGIGDELEVFRAHVSNQVLGGHEDQVALQKREAETIRAVPGVVSVARVSSFPVSRSGSNTSVSVDRKQEVPTAVTGMFVSADSLVKTWKLRLVEGRDFLPDDYVELNPSVTNDFVKKVIVSKALAEKLFPGQSSFVGKEFFFGTGSNANGVTIVGVVETLQTSGAQAGQRGELSTILPARLSGQIYDGYAVRAEAGQRDRVMKEVEEALRKASATPIYVKAKSVEEFRTDRYRSEKGLAWMLLAVSSLLVVVTASGIVGMSTLWVAQRRKQIGIRRALGARRVDVLAYFIAENWLITTCGIVFGIALAVGLNHVLVGQFELPKLPVSYLLFSPLLFWILGVLAVYAPAWRAASISPATATRGV
ncbi:ABC transporter permease [Undibacterium sp. Ji22W]|uniref:ABC transporter permease n=1 Tax=Undibacterium sp. Ji22W TaxID=3413038 RepID=UPI003BF19ADE